MSAATGVLFWTTQAQKAPLLKEPLFNDVIVRQFDPVAVVYAGNDRPFVTKNIDFKSINS